ncbi:DNA repair helicase XPB [Evansella sp. AB-rgal1]|uniref:DNA repair helicase XPB n=1 Tax=Evansella sp. AB-rgal1 TaxID=3242696 RepID=UPI00359CF46E
MSSNMPLTIQNNGTIFFRSNHKEARIVQPFLSEFAQLVKTPSSIHFYELSPYSIWYALDQGISINEVITFLENFSGLPVPVVVQGKLHDWERRNGKFRLFNSSEYGCCVYTAEFNSLREIFNKEDKEFFPLHKGECMPISISERGYVKQRLMEFGYSVIDELGFDKGKELPVTLHPSVFLRSYQQEAVDSFVVGKGVQEGNGFIILPCGSGKTIVGLGVMSELKEETLILVPNDTSLQQWYNELLKKTTLTPSQIGRYTSENKEIRPVTITTYQMLTYHDRKNKGTFPHYSLFHDRSWGLVIYDEVHLLPAPLFRITSNLQGKRRLGLTATFVREDGKEGDIYSLIGPKRYEVGIQLLEQNDWIAKPVCKEIKIPFHEEQWAKYTTLSKRDQYRYASENPGKIRAVKKLLKEHSSKPIIIIGQYLQQLKKISEECSFPLITGDTKKQDRIKLYNDFKSGKEMVLVLSRVANMAVDLPDAMVAIQVSGTYGSRQEEAQRIGRLLRRKKKNEPVYFYTLVTPMTKEEDVASHRQLFMVEQGYSYDWEEWVECSQSI